MYSNKMDTPYITATARMAELDAAGMLPRFYVAGEGDARVKAVYADGMNALTLHTNAGELAAFETRADAEAAAQDRCVAAGADPDTRWVGDAWYTICDEVEHLVWVLALATDEQIRAWAAEYTREAGA
jgi:hypothetical protein